MSKPTRRAFLATSAAFVAAVTAHSVAWPTRFAMASTNDPNVQKMIEAVTAGDLATATDLIAQSPDLVQTRDTKGLSVFALSLLHGHPQIGAAIRGAGYELDLHEAALALDWERLATLAEPDPMQVNSFHAIGGSAMWAAARGGAGSQMWRVYQYGGDPDLTPQDGYSPLRAALDLPDLATAEMTAAALLSNNASANTVEPDLQTGLHLAAARGSSELVEIFIRKGADLDALDPQGRTAQDLAEQNGHSAAANILRNHSNIPRDFSAQKRTRDSNEQPYTVPDFGRISLPERSKFVGASHGRMAEIQRLTKVDPRYAHSVATTDEAAVEAGAHMGNQDIVNMLLEFGASYDLTTVVMRGDVSTLKSRLKAEPRLIHERGAHDFPMLWYPVIGGELLECTEILLDAGADIERQHFLGNTALHYAVLGGQLEMTALLLERGADPNRISRKFSGDGITPLGLAEQRKHAAVAQLLRDRGAL
ncbi:MAG: ankyrin repeat protein [Candidatus Krumholzibacteriia bacterium]|jgi:ankyrin repeat protein